MITSEIESSRARCGFSNTATNEPSSRKVKADNSILHIDCKRGNATSVYSYSNCGIRNELSHKLRYRADTSQVENACYRPGKAARGPIFHPALAINMP